MKKIILDTNFLMIPAAMKVDIFSEIERIMDEPYEIYVLDKTMDELNKIIKEQPGKHKAAAKLALDLAKHKKLKILRAKSLNMAENSKNIIVDDSLVSISDKDTIIATQDGELKKNLHQKGAKIIILRGKKHLEIR
jgi:rRNA-processing protein FCF1